jgi:alkaline phosphatase D
MTLTRRRFLGQATPLGLAAFLPACGSADPADPGASSDQESGGEPMSGAVFGHGLASGDPLSDAVILWTRVTPRGGDAARVDVSWRMASDPEMRTLVAMGTASTDADLDYTVKVDARGLGSDTSYYYDFSALGSRSRVGRTKTLAADGGSHVRLAVTSCANYPAGFFNAYRAIAARADVDLVLHLGDYLYEYGNGVLGDGAPLGRLPNPNKEVATLEEYRLRHAQYKADPDLQEAHRQHPFITVWDDHEISNNGYRDGAANHQPDSEGDWSVRKLAAMRAYFEWMPIRAAAPAEVSLIYRAFAFGDLFDLMMLDTRYVGRDARIVSNCDVVGIKDEARSLLGAEQESWLLQSLRDSHARGARWRLLGQQVMFGQLSDAAQGCVSHTDQWDGYAQSRARVLSLLRDEGIGNVVILTGDAHSSWALDITEDPFDPERYDAATGQGSLAVEFVAPGVTSPGTNSATSAILATHPHLKFADFSRRGYVLLDIDRERVQAEWYFMATLSERRADEELAVSFETLQGENCVRAVLGPSEPRAGSAALAP